jgi:hypothetical protein
MKCVNLRPYPHTSPSGRNSPRLRRWQRLEHVGSERRPDGLYVVRQRPPSYLHAWRRKEKVHFAQYNERNRLSPPRISVQGLRSSISDCLLLPHPPWPTFKKNPQTALFVFARTHANRKCQNHMLKAALQSRRRAVCAHTRRRTNKPRRCGRAGSWSTCRGTWACPPASRPGCTPPTRCPHPVARGVSMHTSLTQKTHRVQDGTFVHTV